MADRVAVFNDGRIVQVGTPEEIYERPAHALRRRFRRLVQRAARRDFAQRLGRPAPLAQPAAGDRSASARRRRGDGGSPARVVSRRTISGAVNQRRARCRRPAAARDRARRRRPLPADGEPVSRSPSAATHAPPDGGAGMSAGRRPVPRHPAGAAASRRAVRPASGAGRGCCCCCCSRRRCCGSASSISARCSRCSPQSFFSIDEFSGLISPRVHAEDLWRAAAARQSRHHPAHGDDGGAGDAGLRRRSPSRSPTTRRATRAAAWKALFYLGVMLPLWSSYLVKVYAWKLILAKEGILTWLFAKLHLSWLLDALLALPVIGGTSLSVSLHRHLHRLRLCLAALHDPADRRRRSSACPATSSRPRPTSAPRPGQTFRNVILPLALPGIVAGSIFTFSLTLGDYIIPQIIGTSRAVHRPGGLRAAGHGRQHPARRRLHGGADRHHGRLSLGRQAHGSLRCALTARSPRPSA